MVCETLHLVLSRIGSHRLCEIEVLERSTFKDAINTAKTSNEAQYVKRCDTSCEVFLEFEERLELRYNILLNARTRLDIGDDRRVVLSRLVHAFFIVIERSTARVAMRGKESKRTRYVQHGDVAAKAYIDILKLLYCRNRWKVLFYHSFNFFS